MTMFLVNVGLSIMVSLGITMISSLTFPEVTYNGREDKHELERKMKESDKNFMTGVIVFFFSLVLTTLIFNLFN